MGVKITTDEWLVELAKLSSRNDDGLTSHEWAESAGLSRRVMMERLQQANRKGWLVVGMRTMTRLDGRPTPIPVYRIVKPK